MKPDIWEDYDELIPEADMASNERIECGYEPFYEPPQAVPQAVTEPLPTTAEPTVQPTEQTNTQPVRTGGYVPSYSLASLADMPLTDEEQAELDAMLKEQMQALGRISKEEQEEQRQRDEEQRRRDTLRQIIEPYRLRASDHLPELTPVIQHKGVIIGSEGNISAVVGEAKSKKTFFCTAIVGSLTDTYDKQRFGIKHRLCKVLWVDTEQSREHIQKVLFRINLLSSLDIDKDNPLVYTQTLREEKPSDRLALMEYAMQYFRPKLVVVDGISDLLTNTNCLEESEALVARLLTLSTQYKCHIMNVLHTNPNSDKARGHLGSTLMRKAETVIFVHRTGDRSVVEPQYCRNEPFERFAFQVVSPAEELVGRYPRAEGLGLPEECELPTAAESREDDCVRILREEFGGSAERKLLCHKLVDILGVTINYANVKITRAIERGILLYDGSVVSLP